MKKRKTYRAPDLYLHRVARLHLLASTITMEASTEKVVPENGLLWPIADGSNEDIDDMGEISGW